VRLHVFREIQLLQHEVFLKRIVHRVVSEIATGTGDVHSFEAVVTQPVVDRELHLLGIDLDAAFDQLLQVTPADPRVDKADIIALYA
jgi:hypothetical protein